MLHEAGVGVETSTEKERTTAKKIHGSEEKKAAEAGGRCGTGVCAAPKQECLAPGGKGVVSLVV